MTSIASFAGMVALSTLSLGANEAEVTKHADANHTHAAQQELSKLFALVIPMSGSDVKGTVVFEKEANGVRVTVDVKGFEPNTKHGFHIHEFGDLSADDAMSTGGHFNPDGHDHALLDSEERHAGDMGNLTADESGRAVASIFIEGMQLEGGTHGILGRAVIIHADEDDGSQPVGNAGARIAAGVIGISKDALASPEK